MRLEDIFRTDNSDRDKFLSRVFGIFSEGIARIWFASAGSLYQDRGRPTIYGPSDTPDHSTLDFTLESNATGEVFVAEMKCELEFENYRYLRLESPSQLTHHQGAAFRRFLDVARTPERYHVKTGGKPVKVHGAILVWGATTEAGRRAVMQKAGIHDVLSLEDMINDLVSTGNQEYRDIIQKRADWSHFLSRQLLGEG